MLRELLIIASGGGHTGFARAIAQYLPLKADFVIPKGDDNSLEMIKDYAEEIYEVPKGREPGESIYKFLVKSFSSISSSIKIPKHKVVIATGSNHSIYPSFFERLKGSKIFAIESQDRIITKGKAVSIISHYAEGIFLHWIEQKKLYPKNGIVVGPIVEKPKYEPKDEGYILVTTGTMGFKRLFDTIVKTNLDNVILQTGKVDPKPYISRGIKAFSFDRDLEKYIANASLVITHQGKTAMEAVVMYKKPTIIVYNKDWYSATTYEDTKLYAEILGASFLPDPSSWENEEVLLKAIQNVKMPKEHQIGTDKLVNVIMRYLE